MLLATVNFEECFLHLLQGFPSKDLLYYNVRSQQMLQNSQTNGRICYQTTHSTRHRPYFGDSSQENFDKIHFKHVREAQQIPEVSQLEVVQKPRARHQHFRNRLSQLF